MLAVPLKKTTSVDWATCLNKYMRSQFSSKDVDEHANSMQRLNNQRSKVVACRASDDNSFKLFYSYLDMLSSVESRFPVSTDEQVMNVSELRQLNFVWHDSFKPKKHVSHQSIAYERACVIYNLGALESHAGMVQDRASMDGLKQALSHFQRAAGCFGTLKQMADDGLIPMPVTSDLTPEGLGLLLNLMLAQAQACYFEKAIKDKHKPGVLSKLAGQAAFWYSEAIKFGKSPSLTSVLDRAWIAHLTFQSDCFTASAEYQYSRSLLIKADETGEGYGEQIARLMKAEHVCQIGYDHAKNNKLPQSMLGTVSHLMGRIQKDKLKAIDDNTKIYMDTIPNMNSLPETPRVALAKMQPIDKEFLEPKIPGSESATTGIFKDLLPPNMREAEALFRSKVSDLIFETGNKVQKQAEDIRLRLAEAGLPAAVESGEKSGTGLPDQIWARIEQQVKQRGGLVSLQNDLSNNHESASKIKTTLNEIEQSLQKEEAADQECRNEFGVDKWTVTPSKELTSSIRNDINRYRELLAQAQSSDESLQQKITASMDILNYLEKPKNELDNMLPKLTDLDKDPKVEELRLEVSLKLVDLGSQINDIEQEQSKLVDEASSDTIVADLVKSEAGIDAIVKNKQQLNQLIEKKLSKHREAIRKIDDKLAAIPRLFDHVLTKNYEFAESRVQNDLTKKREKMLNDINNAITKFDEVATHVREGEKFYTDLSIRVSELNENAKDHVFVRNLQRSETADQLRQQQSRAASESVSISDTNSNTQVPQLNRQGSALPFSSPYGITTDDDSTIPAATAAYPGLSDEDAIQATVVDSTPPSYATTTNSSSATTTSSSSSTNDFDKKLKTMKSTLGLHGVSDDKLKPFIEGAGGDVNTAINHYLESGGEASSETVSNTNAKPATGKKKKKKSSWFSR